MSQENQAENKKIYGYTGEEWMFALLEMLDGSATPSDIHYNTGLSRERCEEISNMYNEATKDGWPKRS